MGKCTIIVLFPVLCIVFYKLVHILRRTCHIKWYTAAEKKLFISKNSIHTPQKVLYVDVCMYLSQPKPILQQCMYVFQVVKANVQG